VNEVKSAGTGTMVLHMGPVHPGLHGILSLDVTVAGEVVLAVRPSVGYLHRGIEKIAENKTYTQIIMLMERLDFTAPMISAFGYCLAVEKLLDLEVPERSQDIRVIMAELSRIQSHLVWLANYSTDLGSTTPAMFAFQQRERILDIWGMVAGSRMHPFYLRIGGVSRDISNEAAEHISEFVETFPRRIDECEAFLTHNQIWIGRTKGVGAVSAEEAIRHGLTGPVLRATGVAHDLRKVHPYSGYERYEFEVPVRRQGDAYDRYLVRINEMRQSVGLVKQGLAALRPGPLCADVPQVIPPPLERVGSDAAALIHHFKIFSEGFSVPEGQAFIAIESPRGEVGIFLVSDGSPRPYRLRVKTPSFMNLQALELLTRGKTVSDLIAILGSLDISMSEVDR